MIFQGVREVVRGLEVPSPRTWKFKSVCWTRFDCFLQGVRDLVRGLEVPSPRVGLDLMVKTADLNLQVRGLETPSPGLESSSPAQCADLTFPSPPPP